MSVYSIDRKEEDRKDDTSRDKSDDVEGFIFSTLR